MKEVCICITSTPAHFDGNTVLVAWITKYFNDVKC